MNSASIAKLAADPVKLKFPFLDLQAQHATIRNEILEAAARVLDSQHFILGAEVQAFERDICERIGCKYAIGCASGSDALILALLALGIGSGDEVVTTPFTFVASAGSIARVGAKPVFVDIDPHTYNVEPAAIAQVITSRTKAIIPVHLFGLAADMGPIEKIAAGLQIPVIEDAAQAIGAAYQGRSAGNIGLIGCFSFFPSKNLGGAGDGGMITTNDSEIAGKLRLLRSHGARNKYEYEILGVNSRLDALQAAILRVKLRYLERWAEARIKNSESYRELIHKFDLDRVIEAPVAPAGFTHVYNQFTVRAKRRDSLREYLQSRGIPNEVYYPKPLHLQPAFSYLGYRPGAFPFSEAASAEVLSFPIFPELSGEQQMEIVQTVSAFYAQKD